MVRRTMATDYVVVWDPTGAHAVGGLISKPDAANVAKHRKAVGLLPTDPQTFHSASPGFVYRPWGKGWAFDAVQPERGCPMLIGVTPDAPFLYWAIQVLPIQIDEPLGGDLRLVGNGATGNLSGVSQEVRLRRLEEYQAGPQGGLVLFGRAALGVDRDGILGLSIHGVARNARVVWSSVSTARERTPVQDAIPV